MCAVTPCYNFTMESFGIVEESKPVIVPELTTIVGKSLRKYSEFNEAKKQLSYCVQNILRDHGCHGCGGAYLCSKSRFTRSKRVLCRVPAC